MGDGTKGLLKDIDISWRATLALFGSIVFGITVGATLISFTSVPAEVISNTARLEVAESQHDAFDNTHLKFDERLDRIIFLMEAERTNTSALGCV